jgi:hypothetical protein
MGKSRELATSHEESSGFSLALPDSVGDRTIADVIRCNLNGEQISPADLNRIRVPAGGATTWEIASTDGEPDAVKTIECVLVGVKRRRAYWQSSNPTGEPPSCSSPDCIIGIGSPGGECDKCPHNQFGSQFRPDGSAGRGKACKEMRLLFILRQGQSIPEIVVIPPGSLKAVRQYLLKLGAPYFSLVTRLSLEKVQNRDGIAFAQVKLVKGPFLDEATAGKLYEFSQAWNSLFESTSVDRDDVSTSEGLD